MDPLKLSPDAEQELFSRFTREANGFALNQVVGAAGNVIVNALRQSNATKQGAELQFDQLISMLKSLLLDKHYDSLGRRLNVFPFAQRIEVPLINLKAKNQG